MNVRCHSLACSTEDEKKLCSQENKNADILIRIVEVSYAK